MIRDVYPRSEFFSFPGDNNTPDPGSGSATLFIILILCSVFLFVTVCEDCNWDRHFKESKSVSSLAEILAAMVTVCDRLGK